VNLRALLTEGASLSARQAISALGRTGAWIEICDPDPLCLGRFSRFVRAWHRCPPWNVQPEEYLRFLVKRLDAEPYDVLLATHDQAFLLSRFRDELRRRVGLALPSFANLERLQSKADFLAVLDELALPHPLTVLVRTRQELEARSFFPCYIKLPHSTAGCGVWQVGSTQGLATAADQLQAAGYLDGRVDILVQEPVCGELRGAHALYQHGALVAACMSRARAQGVGGSAYAVESVLDSPVLEHLAVLGSHLDWHGALCLDYICEPSTGHISYIDANPRPGETMNATLSGLNLFELLVLVSLDKEVPGPQAFRPGVRTHSIVMGLMGLAQEGASRRRLLAELARAWLGRPPYDFSEDELTRPWEDWLSLIPALYLATRLVSMPSAARPIVARTVRNYSLSEGGVEAIRRLPCDLLEPCQVIVHSRG
jgi:predicted ATP-grasp superfamily ATP-dependent carboligase